MPDLIQGVVIQGQCVSDSLTASQSHEHLSNEVRTSSYASGSEILPTLHVCVSEILVRVTLDTCSYIDVTRRIKWNSVNLWLPFPDSVDGVVDTDLASHQVIFRLGSEKCCFRQLRVTVSNQLYYIHHFQRYHPSLSFEYLAWQPDYRTPRTVCRLER